MEERIEVSLRDGTVVRHKTAGYEGKIEGTTSIKACFTKGGMLIDTPNTKGSFQYRVAVAGNAARCIAPAEDLEILDASAAIVCLRCQKTFLTKPGAVGKPGGRCVCGGWICPTCAGCRAENPAEAAKPACPSQRKRFLRKAGGPKK